MTLGELGVSGTTNYRGQLLTETNPALIFDRGYGRPGARVWGEWERIIRTDCAVETALGLITAPLRDASIAVTPPRSEGPAAASQVEYVRQNLEEWLEPTWPELVSTLARTTVGVGFSLHEKCWAPHENKLLPGGVGYKLSLLAQRLASTLEYNAWIEEDGKLVTIQQRGVKDGRYVSNVSLPAEKCLLISWNREGNNYAGYSAFRSVWYLCKIREHLLKVAGIGFQREALGVPMASMDRETKLTTGQRKSLQRFLENIIYHENAAIVLPPGVKLEWFNSPGANKGNVLDAWKKLGIAILEVVSAQQAALGTGDTGSRAVGEVHDSTRSAFVNGLKGTLEAALNGVGSRSYTGVARDIVRLNWGPQAAYPKVELVLPTGSIAATELVASVVAGIGGGLVTPTLEDENHVRSILGLKALTPEVRAAARANFVEERQALQPVSPDADNEASAQPPEREARPEGASDRSSGGPRRIEKSRAGDSLPPGASTERAKGGRGAPASRVVLRREKGAPFVPRRPLKPHEEHLDWDGMDDLLSNSREAFEAAARPILIEELVRVMPAVKEAMADGDPSELSALELPLERMGALVDDFIASMREQGRKHVEAEAKNPKRAQAKEEARKEGEPALKPLARATWSRLAFAKPKGPRGPDVRAREVERLMKAQRELLLRRMRARTIDSLQKAAIDQVRTGGDPQDIVAAVITDALETRALRQDAGLVATQAFNLGREEVAQRLGNVRVVRLSAVLDEVTCHYCERMDGEEFEFNSPEHDAHVPPLTQCEGRDNCRCVLVYEFEEEGFRTEEEYPENNEPRDGEGD